MFKFEPWDVIAGCGLGTHTPRGIVVELLVALEKAEDAVVKLYSSGKIPGAAHPETMVAVRGVHDYINQSYRELASYPYEGYEGEIFELQEELLNKLNEDYFELMPPYCTIRLNNDEYTVTPYIDEELRRLADIPDDYEEDYIYVVNDHGNVSCMRWNSSTQEYEGVWSMV